VQLFPFIERMEYAYAACDLCRVPFGGDVSGRADEDRGTVDTHPYRMPRRITRPKCKAMVEAGAGILILTAMRRGSSLRPSGDSSTIRERLKTMGEAARVLGRPGAVGVLADAVEHLHERDDADGTRQTFKYKLDFYISRRSSTWSRSALGGIRGNFIERSSLRAERSDHVRDCFFAVMSFVTLASISSATAG